MIKKEEKLFDPVVCFYVNCFFTLSSERHENGQIPFSKIIWFKHYYDICDEKFDRIIRILDIEFIKLRAEKIKSEHKKSANKNKLLKRK